MYHWLWLQNVLIFDSKNDQECCNDAGTKHGYGQQGQAWCNSTFLTIQATKQYPHVLHNLALQTHLK